MPAGLRLQLRQALFALTEDYPMAANHHRPARKSPRLQDYDYAQDGAYFVTICTQNRAHLFGAVVGDAMRLNAAGMMVDQWWQELPHKFARVELDLYVVMPNHVHSIVVLNGDTATVGATLCGRPGNQPDDLNAGEGTQALPYTLPDVIGWFKTMTTNAYIRGVNDCGWESFVGKLWQRSFHDHIIRNVTELNARREYVRYNPAIWAEDRYFMTHG
jgi:REP element-mobilizing transposase RayT